MSKIGFFTDPHFSLTSSILNMRSGYEYSARLDLLIKSFEFMYKEFRNREVEAIICGGDLMDSDIIKSEEGSALSKALSYNTDIPEYFLLGNHEKKDDAGRFNSIALLSNFSHRRIIDKPTRLDIGGIKISFLPYNKEIDNCYEEIEKIPADLLVSHMNFNGMNIGKSFVFDDGIDMDRILNNFKLVINGHIHNADKYADGRIYNIGSLFGTGFGDDYHFNYPGMVILDTETLELEHIDNPYAVTFHVIKSDSISELIKECRLITRKRKGPKCFRIEVPYAIRDDAREYIDSLPKKMDILNTRIIGKIENSTVLQLNKDESIESYSSGGEAMRNYINTLDESSLPSTKDKMVKFINDYLS